MEIHLCTMPLPVLPVNWRESTETFFTHSQGNAETERGILWRDFPEMCGGMSGGRRTHRGGEGEIVFPWTLSGISGAGDADEAA